MGNVVTMNQSGGSVNGGRWAPMQNLVLAARAVERSLNRASNLPGIVVLYAPYGTGKSMSESYCANKYEAFHVECQSHFTRKSFAQMVLREMAIKPARTVSDMMYQIGENLDLSQRPLILDDVHRIGNTSVLGLILDLHQMARTTIVLAGNERFPRTLKDYDEQLHSRVLVWQELKPASAEDVRNLARFYCQGLDVADDLLAHISAQTRANARLICINLDHVRDHCQKQGAKKITLEGWGRRELHTGDAPLPAARRSA